MADHDDAQIRWWVVLPTLHSDQRATLVREDAARLADWFSVTEATLQDPIGGGEVQVELELKTLSAFSLKGVISKLPKLSELLTFAGGLDDSNTTAERLTNVLGPGPLLDQLLEEIAPPPPVESGPLSGADIPKARSVAAAAIDSFVRSTSSSRVRRSAKTRKLRDRIEEAVHVFARRALESDEVRAREAAWRGLDMLLSRCPKASSIVVELIGADPSLIPQLLEAAHEAAPDAVFVPAPINDVDLLAELADIAELTSTPIVLELDPAVFETNLHDLPNVLSVEPGKVPRTDWLALRQEESSRWLCVTVNNVLVAHEGARSAQRTVLTSGVWAVSAFLSASFTSSGGFAQISGTRFALPAPVTRVLEEGPHIGTATPTAAFYPLRIQTDLAKHGLLAIGSVRDRARIALNTAPMLRANIDASPLPAQIIVGRIVRFSRWVRDQLPPDVDDETLSSVFVEAARVFLFPGLSETTSLSAKLAPESDEPTILVHAVVHPAIAGASLDIEFPLTLQRS